MRTFGAVATAVSLVAAAPLPSHAVSVPLGQWHRSMLVYHSPGRTAVQWQKHLVRVDANGNFTGQWLFDAAILTASAYNGKDLMYGGFSGSDLNGVLDQLFADASALDGAASTLAAKYGGPPAPIQVMIGMPWIDPNNHSLVLPGGAGTFDTTVPAQRIRVADWYLDQIKARAQSAHWKYLTLGGAYYHREEIIDQYNDPAFVTQFNLDAHLRALRTVWVPYYGAPHMWDARSLGFDASNIQPTLAFRGAQYGGESDDGILYAVGHASKDRGQAFEYESSTGGESPPETWASHQYLAVQQYYGIDVYPQVFFVGTVGDMFDVITTQASAAGDRWWSYSDLANYLAGQSISNLETALPWPTRDMPDGTRQMVWTAPADTPLWAIRMDFSDANPATAWRGTLTVRVDGPGGFRTSFAQRIAFTDATGYHSLKVPLALSARGDNLVSAVTVTLSREAGSDWPTIERLVADQYVMPVIANGASYEESSTSHPVQSGPYSDSAPTYLDFAKGKLTDGLTSPNGSWVWGGVVGWNFYDGQFRVVIDLGQTRDVSEVDLVTHNDPQAAIGWPTDVVALVGLHSPAYRSGVLSMSEPAVATSGQIALASRPIAGSTEQSGTITTKLANAPGRYVTVFGRGSGWIMLDEVVVKDSTGAVISTGRPYTLFPIPSVEQGNQTPYADNGTRLTNTTIIPYFLPQYSQVLDGIPAGTGGDPQVTWTEARPVRQATIWLTTPNQAFGVAVPTTVQAQWRDQNGNWSPQSSVAVVNSGASPHATLVLPFDAQVTGVKFFLPAIPGSNGWYMITEVTAQ